MFNFPKPLKYLSNSSISFCVAFLIYPIISPAYRIGLFPKTIDIRGRRCRVKITDIVPHVYRSAIPSIKISGFRGCGHIVLRRNALPVKTRGVCLRHALPYPMVEIADIRSPPLCRHACAPGGPSGALHRTLHGARSHGKGLASEFYDPEDYTRGQHDTQDSHVTHHAQNPCGVFIEREDAYESGAVRPERSENVIRIAHGKIMEDHIHDPPYGKPGKEPKKIPERLKRERSYEKEKERRYGERYGEHHAPEDRYELVGHYPHAHHPGSGLSGPDELRSFNGIPLYHDVVDILGYIHLQ